MPLTSTFKLNSVNAKIHMRGSTRVQRRMISVVNFFVFLRLLFFCFVVAICYLVQDVKTIFHLSCVLTASGNLSLIFQKRFPDAVNT